MGVEGESSRLHRPDFLYIGPDKSGSTWFYKLLSAHPDCFVPVLKDIYYFDRYYQKGWKWYSDFFSEVPEQITCRGELSHDYLFSPEAAQRIQNDIPDVKLISFLRNPVERAYSHYQYLVTTGITRKPFEEALQEIPRIIDNGMYGKHLSVYFDLFPREQLGVFNFSDLKVDNQRFAQQILAFLDLEWRDDLLGEQKILGATEPRNYYLVKLMKFLANTARNVGATTLLGRMKDNKTIRGLFFKSAQGDMDQMSEQVKSYLTDVYRSDAELAEKLTGIQVLNT